MPPTVPGPLPGRRTVRTIVDRGVTYEQRFNTCGKKDCRRCNGLETEPVGHGPYWYFCVCVKGRWIRIYLGKNLDTARFRTPKGDIDWAAVFASRRRRKEHPATANQKEPAVSPPPGADTPDASDPATFTPNVYCYVCGKDLDEGTPARADRAAANLCSACNEHKTHSDPPPDATPPPTHPATAAGGQHP